MAEDAGRDEVEGELVVGRCRAGPRKGKAQMRRERKPASSKEVRETFLEVLSCTSNVAEACRQAGLSSGAAYRLRARDAGFREAWDAALEAGYAALEMELLRRARFGQDVTEYRIGDDGKEAPVKRVHSYCNRLGLQLLAQHGKAVAEFRAARGAKSDGSRALEEIRRKLLAMKERDGG